MNTQGNEVIGGVAFPKGFPGREKIRVLLLARGFTIAGWARKKGYFPQQVTMTLSGARKYPEIRQALADELGLSREIINELIDGAPRKAAGADEGADRAAA